MSQTITTKKLGELLQHWHESQSDPIYAVGSLLFAGKPVDEEQVKKTRDKIRKLLSSAERGSHGWGQDEVEELRKISDGLAGLLRVYEYGEMPTLDDFRQHLSHDRDAQGRRYISSGKPILRFDLTGDIGKAALDGASQADQDRAAAGKGRADITATQTGDKMSVAVNNIESLHSWIAALANTGPAGGKLAKTIMEDLGYSWTGAQRNPTRTAKHKPVWWIHPVTMYPQDQEDWLRDEAWYDGHELLVEGRYQGLVAMTPGPHDRIEPRRTGQKNPARQDRIRSAVYTTVRGVTVGETEDGRTIIFRNSDYDKKNWRVKGPYEDVSAYENAFYLLGYEHSDQQLKDLGWSPAKRDELKEIALKFLERDANPAKRGGSKGGVMLNDAPYNIEKHLLQGDEVRGRARIGAPHGYFIRVFPYEGQYVFQVSQGASFSGVLQRKTFSAASEAAKHMSDVAAQGLTWHRGPKANPALIFPEDLSTMSASEYRKAVGYLAKKPLKDLRRRQSITRSQIQEAYEQKNTKELRNLQVMELVLADAVDKREFGE